MVVANGSEGGERGSDSGCLAEGREGVVVLEDVGGCKRESGAAAAAEEEEGERDACAMGIGGNTEDIVDGVSFRFPFASPLLLVGGGVTGTVAAAGEGGTISLRCGSPPFSTAVPSSGIPRGAVVAMAGDGEEADGGAWRGCSFWSSSSSIVIRIEGTHCNAAFVK